jgi:hypothetical protein
VTAVEVAAQRGQFLLEARFHQPASNLLRVTVHAMPSIITLPGSARYRTRHWRASNGVLPLPRPLKHIHLILVAFEKALPALNTERTETTEKISACSLLCELCALCGSTTLQT